MNLKSLHLYSVYYVVSLSLSLYIFKWVQSCWVAVSIDLPIEKFQKNDILLLLPLHIVDISFEVTFNIYEANLIINLNMSSYGKVFTVLAFILALKDKWNVLAEQNKKNHVLSRYK